MDPLTIARFITVWRDVRPFHTLKLRRDARKAEAAGIPSIVQEPVTDHPQEHVEAVIHVAATLVGGAKSKLMYLALAQFIYAAAVLWINDGTLTPGSMEPIVFGLFTAVFRIFTGQTLAEKGASYERHTPHAQP